MVENKTNPARRKSFWWFLIPIVVVAFILYLVIPKAEPVYQGKTLTQWIAGLEYENRNPTAEQREALRAMGQPAVTRLIEILQHRDFFLKRKFVEYARHHADIHNRFIAPRTVVPEAIYRAEAATALGEIGPKAKTAIPALIVVSRSFDIRTAARSRAALIKIQKDSLAPLAVSLADTTATNWTLDSLTAKYLGTNGESLVPQLVGALLSTNAIIRELGVEALGGIASQPELSVPALIECIKRETNTSIRAWEVSALLQFKTAKSQIVPVLLPCLQEQDNNVWLSAAFGLEKILSPEEIKTIFVPALIQSLKNPNSTIRENAAMFLKRVDPVAAAQAGL